MDNSQEVNITASMAHVSSSGSQIQGSSATGDPQDSLILGNKFKGNNEGAVKYLESYVNNHPADIGGYVVLYGFADSATTPEIIDFFKLNHPNAPEIHKLLLANLYQMNGKPDLAEEENNSIAAEDSNSSLAMAAEINNMRIELYTKNNVQAAKTILNQVEKQANLINPMELNDAEHMLQSYVDPKTGSMPNAGYQPSGSSTQQSVVSIQQQQIGLLENYPNPFNPTTTIAYQIPTDGHVAIKVFDILGRDVTTLVDEFKPAGSYTVQFDASRLASGIYFYSIHAGEYTALKKMLLLK